MSRLIFYIIKKKERFKYLRKEKGKFSLLLHASFSSYYFPGLSAAGAIQGKKLDFAFARKKKLYGESNVDASAEVTTAIPSDRGGCQPPRAGNNPPFRRNEFQL